MAEGVSYNKVDELKSAVHNYLSQADVHKKIQQVLASGEGLDTDPEESVLQALEDEGFVDKLVHQFKIKPGDVPKQKKTGKSSKTDAGSVNYLRRQLYVQVQGGKAFMDNLQDDEPMPGQHVNQMTLHVSFKSQRFKSRPIQCSCDPDFQEAFLLELHRTGEKMLTSADLLTFSTPIHFVITKTDTKGESSLIASCFFDWRDVLAETDGKMSLSLELMGVAGESKVPAGILEVSFEVLPSPETLSIDVVAAQISLEKKDQGQRERLFLTYSKQWWREYLQIRSTHRDRYVKIFAQDENLMNRPVCAYVEPTKAGRLLESPRHAARFVQLLQYDKLSTVGTSTRSEQWTSTHAFLATNKGDCENHACLLCSLLLGYGLSAYVCLGTKQKGVPHAWVATLSHEDGTVTFWESLTGSRYIHRAIDPNEVYGTAPTKPVHAYRTIGCLFNHNSFYANVQPSDSVEVCQFDLSNESHWKSMSGEALASVCQRGVIPSALAVPPLQPSLYDPITLGNAIESELRGFIRDYRMDLNLDTVFDDNLSYVLAIALSAYEIERITGTTVGLEEFRQGVTNAIPDKHTFRGYPIQVNHLSAKRAFGVSLKNQLCRQIVESKGDVVRLGIRVKVCPYAESSVALWIMYACRYKCIL